MDKSKGGIVPKAGSPEALHNVLDGFHQELSRLNQEELEIRQKRQIINMAAINELTAIKGFAGGAELLARRVVACW